MKFEIHRLTPPLDQYLESVFHMKGFMPDHSVERVVPTGHVFIIFELDGFERSTFDNDSLKPIAHFTKVWISGMHKNYLSISAHQNSEMLVMQFKPFGGFPFFHFPVEELNEKVLSTQDLFDGSLLQLREEILAKATSEEKFQVAESWLRDRFDEAKQPPNEIIEVVETMQKAPVANGTLLENYPFTQKHLIDQFKKYIGLTPKYFQRILRFNEILQRLHKQEKISWTEIAYQCGFSDQSHFIKEFKHFSGFNPEEFILGSFNNDEPNFFPLDREG